MVKPNLSNLRVAYLRFKIVKSFDFDILRPYVSIGT